MRHLVIGRGNMGKRYISLLGERGEDVESVDLEFEPERCLWKYDSVFICTPAYNHVRMLASIPAEVPVFCEKPLICRSTDVVKKRKKSFVSCPWLFCPCVLPFDGQERWSISCQYESKCRYRRLDLIHFVPFFCGESFSVIKDDDYVEVFNPGFSARITWGVIGPSVVENQRRVLQIHEKPCSMFGDMVDHWLDVLRDDAYSLMPFERSLPLHKKLLGALTKPNGGSIIGPNRG